ncbi:hypothetical protein [Arcobacter arenosus]|uniref:Uncharacterized protein n=1 Tax=Arcobacter arenosus TaxID=2576037 RepID=A0A5R8XYB5_9BACT|nr:hypothetical protein [Arcobacter arenosus]TLP36213.1 hypothetical protein FDK22_13160 [Arcobacter arenosus]
MFNSLKKKIEKELEGSIYKNNIYKELKWDFIESYIVSWSKNYILQIFKYFLFFYLLFISITILFELLRFFQVIDFFLFFKKNLDFKDTIFNGQLTILAVIFPLVIGFVGVLIKDDIANKSLWKIYNRYSGFMLVGFSGLSLSAIIILDNYFKPFLIDELSIVISLIYSFWFLLNLLLLSWLLHSTFNFINKTKQNEIIKKYTTNIVLEEEIRKRLYSLIPKIPDKLSLLPTSINANQKISFHFFEKSKDNLDKVSRKFKKKQYLLDINFTFLSLAIKLWMFRNSYFLIKENMELFLPTTVDGYSYKDFDLALLKNDKFTVIENFLIRRSYKFISNNPFEDDDVENIVNSLFNNIDKAINSNNQRLFDDEEETLRDFLQTIFSITSFINDEGKIDNWLLLSNNSFFSHKLYYNLLSEFYSLNKILISKIISEDYFYRSLSSFYPYSFSKQGEKLHHEIQKGLMELHVDLWINLLKENRRKEISNLNSLLKTYIGSWESWGSKYSEFEENWEIISNYSNVLFDHLILSNSLIIESLKFKNYDASIWSVNIVNNWYSNQFSMKKTHIDYLWKKEILSTSFFLKEKDEKLLKFILNNNEEKLEDVFTIALKNIWFQSKVITASYIFNKNSDELTTLDRKIIFSLIKGDKITPLDEKDFSNVFNNNYASEILETYLLNLYPFSNITNNGISKKLIKKFNRIHEEEHISGRIYSGFGGENISNVKDCIIALIISNSKNEFKISDSLYDFIFSELVDIPFRDSIISYLEELLVFEVETESKVKALLNTENILDLINNYKKSINAIIDKIKDATEEEVYNTPINESRIVELKKYLSKSAFKKDDSILPLKLFNSVIEVEETKYESLKLNIQGINKRDLISNEINKSYEEDTYSELMNKQVYIKLFRDIFNKIDYKNKEFISEEDLIINILRDKILIKNSIIFIGSNKVRSYLRKLIWENNDNVPFTVKNANTIENDYLCHINDTPVYSIYNFKIDFCLLINLDIFKQVEIKVFDNKYFVDLKFMEYEDKTNSGLLQIEYSIESIFNSNYDCYKYTLAEENV